MTLTFTDLYTRFIDNFLPTVTTGISSLFTTLGQTFGEIAEFVGVDPSTLPAGVRDITLFSAILGVGISFVIVYTLVKWVLDIVL